MQDKFGKYMRVDQFRHILCAGCGHGIIMNALIRAIDEAQLEQEKTVIISGIGCSSRVPGYLNFDTLHSTHGRALAFATGVKLAKPELNVIVITGDGDASAIGGNHLIHACRRNIDITTIVFNNKIYGMTSGQYSPMTPVGDYATTSPYGNIDREFDICRLAEAAGATFVARSTAYHAVQLTGLIAKALANKGFSLVEGLSQCPTYYGRRNKMGDAVKMLTWQKEHAVPVTAAAKLPPEKLVGKFTTGILHHQEAPEYTEEYQKTIAKLQRRHYTE